MSDTDSDSSGDVIFCNVCNSRPMKHKIDLGNDEYLHVCSKCFNSNNKDMLRLTSVISKGDTLNKTQAIASATGSNVELLKLTHQQEIDKLRQTSNIELRRVITSYEKSIAEKDANIRTLIREIEALKQEVAMMHERNMAIITERIQENNNILSSLKNPVEIDKEKLSSVLNEAERKLDVIEEIDKAKEKINRLHSGASASDPRQIKKKIPSQSPQKASLPQKNGITSRKSSPAISQKPPVASPQPQKTTDSATPVKQSPSPKLYLISPQSTSKELPLHPQKVVPSNTPRDKERDQKIRTPITKKDMIQTMLKKK